MCDIGQSQAIKMPFMEGDVRRQDSNLHTFATVFFEPASKPIIEVFRLDILLIIDHNL
jgi:hypothetical protein